MLHTEKETSVLRQLRGMLGTQMISTEEHFVRLVGTLVKDGCVSVETIANALGRHKTIIEGWVVSVELPESADWPAICATIFELIERELEESLAAY